MNIIDHTGQNPCSGCGVCAAACPHGAIAFGHDADGFLTPRVDDDRCTDCGICTKVCYKYLEPNPDFENTFDGKAVYGAWSRDPETVVASSSGGVGHELASHFHRAGYKVCGCVFDAPNDACKHIIAENSADLDAIRTSKYLQSYTVDAFSQFRKGEKYLVIGTPCQMYGLRRWIEMKRWEDNFVLVDFFCHGTPSVNLWTKYKTHLHDRHGLGRELANVNFRRKSHVSKWHSYAISIRDFSGREFEMQRAFAKDVFFRFFLNNSCLGASCHRCLLRRDHCAADIRIADFWGPKYVSNEWGVSLVVANTERGARAFEAIRPALVVETCSAGDLRASQGTRFIAPNKRREAVLRDLRGDMPLERIYRKHQTPCDLLRRSIVWRGLSFIKRRLLK